MVTEFESQVCQSGALGATAYETSMADDLLNNYVTAGVGMDGWLLRRVWTAFAMRESTYRERGMFSAHSCVISP